MLNAVLALNELDTRVFDSTSLGASPGAGTEYVTVPDAHLLFTGEFKRVGTNDLKIVGQDGESFFIADYFASDKRPHLMSPQGATLSPHVVESLAGPLAPGQHAQAGAPAGSTQPVIGRVEALSGSATVVRNGVTVSLNVGDNVRRGDVVQTSGSSSVSVVLADGSTFSMSANARMVLDNLVFNASGAGNSGMISLVQGSFSFVAGQVAKNGEMRVETPVATMGIRGTAVSVEISASDGQTRFSVMVEPDGTTGSFNLYNKTTGALIGTVNNSQIGWVVTPSGPLQVVAQQEQKTPAQLQQELGIVQQIFTIFNNNQQNPFVPPSQEERRADSPDKANPGSAQGAGGSGQALTVTVPVTTPENPVPTNVNVTITPVTPTAITPTAPTIPVGTPPPTSPPIVTPTINIIRGEGPIEGTAGIDQIWGSDNNDTVDAKAGNDFVFAEGGDDVIFGGHGEGNDFYDGGNGHDKITFTSAAGLNQLGVTFNLNSGTFSLAGVGVVKSSTAESTTTGLDVFVRVEEIVASSGNDTFILHDAGDWLIDAGAGIDIVRFANGLDIVDVSGGPEISNFEILDLATDTSQNIVQFDVSDFDSIGNSVPLRVLGGSNDIINLTNHFGIGALNSSKGTFVDPTADGQEGDPFNDHFSDGVTFDVYKVTVGGETISVYIQHGIQVATPNDAPVVTAGPPSATLVEDSVLQSDVQLSLSDPDDDVVAFDLTGWVPTDLAHTQAYDGHFYLFVSTGDGMSWNAAQQAAAAMGGYLATITSQGENDFVFNSVVAGQISNGSTVAYIGGALTPGDGAWRWYNGDENGDVFYNNGASSGYTNWRDGEPNNYGGNENILVMEGDGTWNDAPRYYGAAVGFVVEFSDFSDLSRYPIWQTGFGLQYGNVTLEIETGVLTYNLDNFSPAVQALGSSSHVTDSVTVSAIDEHGATGSIIVTFDINGADENKSPVANNVALEANLLGNGGFEAFPSFEGWTIDATPQGMDDVDFSTVTLDRSGTIFEDDNAVAVLNFSGSVPVRGNTAVGPSIISDAFSGYAGDTIKFVYQLSSGSSSGSSDKGIVIGRIIDTGTNSVIQEITNEADLGESTGAITYEVELQYSGNFRIEFEVQSEDATRGFVVGTRLDLGFAGIIRTGITEDTPFTFSQSDFLSNVSDPDGDELELNSVAASTSGALVYINADGSVTYDPSGASAIQALAAGESVIDTFTFTVRDQHGAVSNVATAHVTVLGANDAPATVSDSAFVLSGDSVEISVLVNDADVDGDLLLVTGVGQAANGTVSITKDGTVIYIPNEGFSGEDSFSYFIADSHGGEASGHVSVVVGHADHQQVGGDVFLQGNFMEIGVSSSGSLGTANSAPAGYHPQGFPGISYVVDIDGWDTGAPPTAGDFTLPGSPVDSIVVGHDGLSFANDERIGARAIATATFDTTANGILRATTNGTTSTGLEFTQIIELDPGATYYKTIVLLQNMTESTMDDVRFMRSFDPDQDIANYNSFETENDVLANPTETSDLAISQAFGPRSGVSVNLIAFDANARASNFGFQNHDAYDPRAYDSPHDDNGDDDDEAITLTFSVGDLGAGEHVQLEFYTSLNGNQGGNDMLVGTDEVDSLNGRGGNDIILALRGNDIMTGGAGNDKFVLSLDSGHDTIVDFTPGAGTDDVIELRGYDVTFESLIADATMDGGDTVLHLSAADSIRLMGVEVGQLHRHDFVLI